MKDHSEYWREIQPADTHTKEFQMVGVLNNHLMFHQLPFRIERVMEEGKDNMWSDHDAELYELDLNTLKKGALVVKIDFERKPKDRFNGGCPGYWSSANFLHRKVTKQTYRNQDLYVLHDNDYHDPHIIWATFGTIRSVGVDNKNHDRVNRFYCVYKKHYDKLNVGYDTFINHITNPKKERVWFG